MHLNTQAKSQWVYTAQPNTSTTVKLLLQLLRKVSLAHQGSMISTAPIHSLLLPLGASSLCPPNTCFVQRTEYFQLFRLSCRPDGFQPSACAGQRAAGLQHFLTLLLKFMLSTTWISGATTTMEQKVDPVWCPPQLLQASLLGLKQTGDSTLDFLDPFLPPVFFDTVFFCDGDLAFFAGGGVMMASSFPFDPRFFANSSGWILGNTPPLAMVTPFNS